MAQPLWKIVWQFLKNCTYNSHDLAILLQSIYPKEIKKRICTKNYTRMVLTALFINCQKGWSLSQQHQHQLVRNATSPPPLLQTYWRMWFIGSPDSLWTVNCPNNLKLETRQVILMQTKAWEPRPPLQPLSPDGTGVPHCCVQVLRTMFPKLQWVHESPGEQKILIQ